MSLSGLRPAVISPPSSRNRLPAFGPRMTRSSALPSGRAPSDAESGKRSSLRSPSSYRFSDQVEVVSPGRAEPGTAGIVPASWVPQFEQNRALSEFGRPHRAQKMDDM